MAAINTAISEDVKMTAVHFGTRLLLRLIRKKRLCERDVRKVVCCLFMSSINLV